MKLLPETCELNRFSLRHITHGEELHEILQLRSDCSTGYDEIPVRYLKLGQVRARSRDFKEKQVDEKYRKVFVIGYVVMRTAAMFLASALNRGSHCNNPQLTI